MNNISKEFIEGYLIGQSNGAGGGGTLGNVSGFTGGISGSSGVVNLSWNAGGSGAENVLIKRKTGTGFSDILGSGSMVYTGSAADSSCNDVLPDLYHSYCYRTITKKGDLYNASDNSIIIPAVTRGKYLYNAGDQCRAVTGGWVSSTTNLPYNVQNTSPSWGSTSCSLDCTYGDTDYKYKICGVRTNNRVDFTGFSKICAEVELTQVKKYDLADDSDYVALSIREMPYYNYDDIDATAEEYPYVLATYRSTNYSGNYWVYFSTLPFYYSSQNGVSKIITNGSYKKCLYAGNGTGVLIYSYSASQVITEFNIPAPTSTPNTAAPYNEYMGGVYSGMNLHVAYAISGNPKVVTETRFWLSTKKLQDYNWSKKVSYAVIKQSSNAGSAVLEMSITADIDTTVSPPVTGNYVSFGAFEADVNVLAIWLQE